MITIAIANQKGGVGKTTTAVTLAEGLARRKHRTLLLDLDAQAHCAIALGMEPSHSVYKWLLDDATLADLVIPTSCQGLDLLPGSKRTLSAVRTLSDEGGMLSAIKDRLKRARYDYVVLDNPPGAGGLQEAALFAADLVVIPADSASLTGVADLVRTLAAINDRGGKARLLGILPTFFDATTESKTNLATLQARFPDLVLDPIRRRVALRECWAVGQTIWEYEPGGAAAKDYAALVFKVEAAA
jgi:chromosome partitioning protein